MGGKLELGRGKGRVGFFQNEALDQNNLPKMRGNSWRPGSAVRWGAFNILWTLGCTNGLNAPPKERNHCPSLFGP